MFDRTVILPKTGDDPRGCGERFTRSSVCSGNVGNDLQTGRTIVTGAS